jgi:hypothetical protein
LNLIRSRSSAYILALLRFLIIPLSISIFLLFR